MDKKIVSFIIFSCFLTLSISPLIASSEDKGDVLIYGFIVSLVACENAAIENQINCRIKHMINDFLREQIPVFWATTNITVLTNEMEQNFYKGTFIIPFTGNNTLDTKLTAIIYDYNQSSEIEENNIKIPVYELMEELNVQVYKLSEVKIAIFKSSRTDGESFYLDAAGKCGFLTFEFLEDEELSQKLNNTAFNVIVWPGGDTYYSSKILKLFRVAFSEFASSLFYNRYNIIRGFIGSGGAYIGSCYGAFYASCGVLPFPIYLKRRAYNPKLRSIGILAISDVLTVPIITPLVTIHERIVDNTHPVTYGLGTIWTDAHLGGPRFVHVGKNSQVVATFYNTSRTLDGTPSWISSRFGDGKVMIFSGHPEFIDSDVYPNFMKPAVEEYYVGKKIISNAFYYTTSKEKSELQTSQSKPLSFITEIWGKTSNLTADINEMENILDEIKNSINETIGEITDLINKINMALDLIREIADEKNIDVNNESITFLNYFYTRFTTHYLRLFIEYFEDTIETLNVMEKIYPLLKNDTNFVQQVEALKTDLSTKINESKIILSNSQDIIIECEEALLDYQQNQNLPTTQEKRINEKTHKFNKQIGTGFQHIPQMHFNSLKFLRHYWYNYESMV